MDKTRLYTLTKEQLSTFLLDDNGNMIVPDTFEVYIVPSREDLRKQRVAELEEQLATMTEPTEEELIQEGKMMHGYFTLKEELDNLKQE